MCCFEKQLWKPFHYFSFDTLPKAEKILIRIRLFCHKILYMLLKFVPNLKVKKVIQKKNIQNLPTYVTVRIHFNTTNFDTLPRAENCFFTMKFLA